MPAQLTYVIVVFALAIALMFLLRPRQEVSIGLATPARRAERWIFGGYYRNPHVRHRESRARDRRPARLVRCVVCSR